MSITDYREQAKKLSGPAADLLSGVLEKYTASILEEMHDQLELRDKEIDKLRETLATAISWLRTEYGDESVSKLLDMLHKD